MSGSVRGIVNQSHQQTLVARRDLDMSTRQYCFFAECILCLGHNLIFQDLTPMCYL
jgi:hypothetical protein